MKKMSDKQRKKIAKKTITENCQEDIQQRYYINRMTRGLIRNTGKEQKEIGNNRRKKKQKNKEL